MIFILCGVGVWLIVIAMDTANIAFQLKRIADRLEKNLK
jgi:hypothetical protein